MCHGHSSRQPQMGTQSSKERSSSTVDNRYENVSERPKIDLSDMKKYRLEENFTRHGTNVLHVFAPQNNRIFASQIRTVFTVCVLSCKRKILLSHKTDSPKTIPNVIQTAIPDDEQNRPDQGSMLIMKNIVVRPPRFEPGLSAVFSSANGRPAS